MESPFISSFFFQSFSCSSKFFWKCWWLVSCFRI